MTFELNELMLYEVAYLWNEEFAVNVAEPFFNSHRRNHTETWNRKRQDHGMVSRVTEQAVKETIIAPRTCADDWPIPYIFQKIHILTPKKNF